MSTLLKIAKRFSRLLAIMSPGDFPSVEDIYSKIDNFAEDIRYVVNKLSYDVEPTDIIKDLINRGLNPESAHLALRSAQIFAKDVG
jgi:hypothetical protein